MVHGDKAIETALNTYVQSWGYKARVRVVSVMENGKLKKIAIHNGPAPLTSELAHLKVCEEFDVEVRRKR